MRVSNASEDDWALVRSGWERGLSWAACSTAIEGRAAATTIRRRAIAEGWEREDGAAVKTPEQRRAQTENASIAAGAALARRRGELIDNLVDDANRLRGQLFAPVLRREVKLVSGGQGAAQEVQVVDVELPVMPPAQQKDTALAFAIIVDKALLLAGEATARTETIVDRDAMATRARQLRDELAERRAAKEIQEGATG